MSGSCLCLHRKGSWDPEIPPSPQSTEPLLQARPGAQRPSGPASPAGQGWRARPLAPGGWRPCRKREAGTVGCQPLTTLATCFGTSVAAQGGKLRRTPGGGHQGPQCRAAGHKCPPLQPSTDRHRAPSQMEACVRRGTAEAEGRRCSLGRGAAPGNEVCKPSL